MMRLTLIAMLAACSSSPLTAGEQCGSNAACASGLSCLEIGEALGAVCEPIADICTIACGSNADCSSLGASYMCFQSCGSALVCAATDMAEPN